MHHWADSCFGAMAVSNRGEHERVTQRSLDFIPGASLSSVPDVINSVFRGGQAFLNGAVRDTKPLTKEIQSSYKKSQDLIMSLYTSRDLMK